MRRLLIAIAACATLALTSAAPALAATSRAHAGDVSAVFTYSGSVPNYRNLHLTITRAGAVVYDAPVVGDFCGHDCWPGAGTHSVHVLDLSGDGTLEVLLDLYSGGAHCCSIEQVFSPSASLNGYVLTERNFGDYGDVVKRLSPGGPLDFVSADDAFAYAFTAFAGSGLPIQILTFEGLAFHDVTGRYPALIRRDAADWLKAYRQHTSDGEGLIAAWAADELRLHRSAQARAYLDAEVRRHHLRARFVSSLMRFLRRHGY